MTRKVYLVLDDVRSAHNVGSMLRTAEGLGVFEVALCGITPYPLLKANDPRPPYLANKIARRIAKTALGAESSQNFSYYPNAKQAFEILKANNVEILALEQDASSVNISSFSSEAKAIALVVGNEVDGINKELIKMCDRVVEIPMKGSKESYNVSVAAAMGLFYLTLML